MQASGMCLTLEFTTIRRPNLRSERGSSRRSAPIRTCLGPPRVGYPDSRLEAVEISTVSDESIAHVHREFMGDPSPTDVITFHHGEIIVSLDTAQRQAAENGEPYEREVTAISCMDFCISPAGMIARKRSARRCTRCRRKFFAWTS